MTGLALVWATLLAASTAGGLVFAHLGSRSSHLSLATSGVIACITVSSAATILLVTSDVIALN